MDQIVRVPRAERDYLEQKWKQARLADALGNLTNRAFAHQQLMIAVGCLLTTDLPTDASAQENAA